MDDLAQELIKAQAEEREALTVLEQARANFSIASRAARRLETMVAVRSFADAGIVMGKTVVRLKANPGVGEYLAVGVDGRGVLEVKAQTRTGKWFKRTQLLRQVKATDLEILRHEGGEK